MRLIPVLVGLCLLLAVGAPDAARAQAVLTNPVLPADVADPSVTVVDARFHVYRTSPERSPSIVSGDLATWTDAGDALPQLPTWSEPGWLWAPAVLQRDGGFVFYYTTRETASGLQCLSRARGQRPEGPFLDTSSGPFVCQRDRNGSIDPDPFVDADGTPYLLFKSEGVPGGEPPTLWGVQLSADGYDLAGEPFRLLERDLDWEGPLIEAPSMVLVEGRYHLFYSGNATDVADYAVGHAVCETVRGPCRKTGDRPLLASTATVAGPGGQDVFVDPDGALWLAYHGWEPAAVGYPGGRRRLHLAPLAFDGDRALVGPATGGPVSLVRAQRVAGADRYATAAALSAARFAPGVATVTVTTGADFPDALASAPAARAGGGPVLLVATDDVPAPTAAELARLRPSGIRVIGGPQAVPDAVVERLAAIAGVPVERVGGVDRAATAAAVSRTAFPSGAATALVVSGEVAADALAAGGAGASLGAPLLLTGAAALPGATLEELRRLAPARVLVVGGEQRVGEDVLAALRATLESASVQRVDGPDRYATAVALARAAFGAPVDEVVAATGERFPDALTAGGLARPVLLVPPGGVPDAVQAEAVRLASERVLVLGGVTAVDQRSFADLDF
jgi:putative cell wall-binding protein